MLRTYKSKKETGGGVDPRDMLFTVDEKSSAFDAFYIQNIKQTKRELSCMGTSNQNNTAANKVRKRKYVRRVVKDVETPIRKSQSMSRSTYLTPDKSIHVNRGEDLFDKLLNGTNNLFDKLRLSKEKTKTYSSKKLTKATTKRINCSSSESSDSDKENNAKLAHNMTNILKHVLLIEAESSLDCPDDSINHLNNSLFTKKNSEEESPRKSSRLKNRLTKNLPMVEGSPLCSTPFTEKYRSKSIYNFSPISMGDLNESKDESCENKPHKTEDLESDALDQVPERCDDIVHSPILKCKSKGSVSSNSSSRSNNSQTKKCSKGNMTEHSITQRESSTETVMQKEKSSEVSVYEDSAEITPLLGFSINALHGTSIYKVLNSTKKVSESSLQNKKSLIPSNYSLNEPKEKRLKINSLENVTEEHHELTNIDQANAITDNEIQISREVGPFIGFFDTTAKNTEDTLKYSKRINKSNDNSVTGVTMVVALEAQHDNKTVRNSFNSATSIKLSNTLHFVSKAAEEIGNESVNNNDDKESFSDTCNNWEVKSDASLNNSSNSERKEPVIVLDKLNDSTFKNYYEKFVEIYSLSNCNLSIEESNNAADESVEKETAIENESYMKESHDGSIEFEENDTMVDTVNDTCYGNITSNSDESEANETLYKLSSRKNSIPCEENTIIVDDNGAENETFSSIDEADESVGKGFKTALEYESYLEESHDGSIEFEESNILDDNSDEKEPFSNPDNSSNDSRQSDVNETLYSVTSQNDSIEVNTTIVKDYEQNESSNSTNNLRSYESPNESLNKEDESIIDEENSTVIDHNDKNTVNTSIAQADSKEATGSQSNVEEEKINFVTIRRRNEITNVSVITVLDDSYGSSSSSDCDKTVMSNKCNKDLENSIVEDTVSRKVCVPKLTEYYRKSITTRTSSKKTQDVVSSVMTVVDDSYGRCSSSDSDKKVLSYKCNKEDLENSKVADIVSRKVSVPKLTENDRKSINMRRSSKNTLNNTQLEESNLDCSTVKQAIVLQPGKKWERSLSIYRRMTVLSSFNSSILDDEDCTKKGRNYRQSVLNTMEMQEHIGPLHNDSFSSFSCSIAPKPHRSTIRIVKEPSSSSSRVSLCTTTVFDDLTGFLAEECDDTLINLSKLSIADSDHNITVVEKLHDTSGRHTTARDYVLRRCDQTAPILFNECYPETLLKNCRKIGEGVYGEVFLWRARDGPRVMKVVPVAGACKVNGEPQKDYHEIIAEIVIAMELSALRAPIAAIERHFDEGLEADSLDLHSIENATDAFNEVKAVRCVHGHYPSRLLDLWELYDESTGSENDNPAVLPPDQQYIVLELANAGQDLESYTFNNAEQAYALFLQVVFALAVGEESLQFEHRDLHWGNLLIAPTEQKYATFVIGGRIHRIPRRGVAATIIDYSLSRVSLPLGGGADCAALYNDLSSDDALFDAVGDYQFEVYRLMREKIQNDWKTFEPYTNVLWLHYIADKMITALRYKRTNTKLHKLHIAKLRGLRARILEHTSAKHLLMELLHNEL